MLANYPTRPKSRNVVLRGNYFEFEQKADINKFKVTIDPELPAS